MTAQALEQIYVLNVKKFTQRRSFMEQQLASFGLRAEFIFDWDVEDLKPDVQMRYFAGTQLSPAQQSCALKHLTALQKIAARQTGLCLVLEDDAVFTADFTAGLQAALTESVNYSGDKVIYIGSGGNFFTPKSQRKPEQRLYPGFRGRFADSYLLDSQTAQKRLDWLLQHKISEPMDNQFELIDKALGIAMLWLEDPVVEQGSKNGLFNSSLEPAPPPWLQGMLFGWEKLKRKYIYQLWR